MDNLPKGTLVNLKDLSIEEIIEILDTAEEFLAGKRVDLSDKLVANLFFEPSTRTRYSFEAAESRLGCQVLSFAKEASSMLKGESLYDTVKTFSQYVDAIIIRHSEDNYYEELIGNIPVPIINGGDGCGNHPTQSLLDLLTIRQEFGKFEGLKIVIVGDIVPFPGSPYQYRSHEETGAWRFFSLHHRNFRMMKRIMWIWMRLSVKWISSCYCGYSLNAIRIN